MHRKVILCLILLLPGAAGAFSESPGERAETVLPMGTVFDQGRTEWCWAYSAYHTLRTYYRLVANDGGALGSSAWDWREVLLGLDSPSGFRSYMENHFSTGRHGHPHDFIRLLEKENPPLKDVGWQDF